MQWAPSLKATDRTERLAAKRHRRLENAKIECEILLPFVAQVDTIIHVGIGHWLEGPHLLKAFPHANYAGIEPVERYIKEAQQNGYPGEITQGCAWNVAGGNLVFDDRREKSSVFVQKGRKRRAIVAPTYTLDSLFSKYCSGSIFLWMDCEGSESQVIDGARQILAVSNYVLAEIRVSKKGCHIISDDVESKLCNLGFRQIANYKHTALFFR